MAGSVRREGGPRSEEGADHKLTPSCFSPDSPHNLTLTPSPGVGCREKLLELGKGVLLPTVGLSGTALKKEGPESGAIGAKGLWVPGGTTRTHPGSQAEATDQVFGQGDLLVPQDTGGAGTDCVVPPGLRGRICQLGVL